jgi:L-cystine uptake protein TcyP (sodium:dicarboxylate symporter family)
MTEVRRGGRKPGEPIYLRRHMVALALAVILPLILLQLYKIYVGPLSFEYELGVGLFLSVILGLALHLTYRSSAKNQP